jgi:hypothetical protein
MLWSWESSSHCVVEGQFRTPYRLEIGNILSEWLNYICNIVSESRKVFCFMKYFRKMGWSSPLLQKPWPILSKSKSKIDSCRRFDFHKLSFTHSILNIALHHSPSLFGLLRVVCVWSKCLSNVNLYLLSATFHTQHLPHHPQLNSYSSFLLLSVSDLRYARRFSDNSWFQWFVVDLPFSNSV